VGKVNIHLIWAQARNRVIGKDGVMPWHLPEDLAHFKSKTAGCPVSMGRRTWDSLPARFKPLPGRRNMVITRDAQWPAAKGQNLNQTSPEAASSVHKALLKCEHLEVVWGIGGGQIYAQLLPYAAEAEVTLIDADFDGDTFAPAIPQGWVQTADSQHRAANGMAYRFTTHRNPSPLPWRSMSP
jgi:dihydrofolate reductase